MADRNEKGHFLKGNKVAKGNKNPYQPRQTSGYFKQTVNDILGRIPIEDVVDRMYELESDKFVYIYNEFMKLQQNQDVAELKNKIELIKIEKEKGGGLDSEQIINITFTDVDDAEIEDDE